GLGILGDQLALTQVVINDVLFCNPVERGGVAKPAAPLDQVLDRDTVLRNLRGDLRKVAVLGELERLFRMIPSVGELVLNPEADRGGFGGIERVVENVGGLAVL